MSTLHPKPVSGHVLFLLTSLISPSGHTRGGGGGLKPKIMYALRRYDVFYTGTYGNGMVAYSHVYIPLPIISQVVQDTIARSAWQ